ncbi:hypothetical protein FNAPI_6734 [Fusarium napiforme]|uniref:Uncharacterized protein n=1 Tax=Fusarium napiforme TaxID=42672 RepID=A0A8H5JEP0_9HYPO|nr:hypothetical protein FNAPI_6734 [Fusarium napiforme]
MVWPARSGYFFIIFTTLESIHAINTANRAEERQTLGAPAAVTDPPLAVIDPLNLLLGYGPELKRRAESDDSGLAVTIAPDETCGTDSDQPYCRTYIYPGSIFDYRCESTTVDEIERVYFTSEGKKRANLVTTTLDPDSPGTSEDLEPVVTVTAQRKSSESPSVVTIYFIPQLPSAAATSSLFPTSNNKSTPVGPIVGGVVGGVAILGLIGLGAFCFVRRRRKNNHQEGMAPVNQSYVAQSMNQNQYPYHLQHQGAIAPYTDASMVLSPPLDARGQLSPPMVQNPAPAYEMAGIEAREPEPVYEMGGDSPGRK